MPFAATSRIRAILNYHQFADPEGMVSWSLYQPSHVYMSTGSASNLRNKRKRLQSLKPYPFHQGTNFCMHPQLNVPGFSMGPLKTPGLKSCFQMLSALTIKIISAFRAGTPAPSCHKQAKRFKVSQELQKAYHWKKEEKNHLAICWQAQRVCRLAEICRGFYNSTAQ